MKPTETAVGARVVIETDADIVSARTRGRALALQIGFSATQATLLATAISELARNILLYAGRGEIQLAVLENSSRIGIGVVAKDCGPGIADLTKALQDGYSTSGRLGLGLPGVRRLADSFEVRSSASSGTVVAAKMWLH
jgi:serine/threonine-protein kinase RsbT